MLLYYLVQFLTLNLVKKRLKNAYFQKSGRNFSKTSDPPCFDCLLR